MSSNSSTFTPTNAPLHNNNNNNNTKNGPTAPKTPTKKTNVTMVGTYPHITPLIHYSIHTN